MSTAIDIEAIRREFPALDRGVFLQHGGASPMPLRSVEAVARVARLQAELTPGEWSDLYRDDVGKLKAALGRLLNVDPLDLALTRATAHGLSLLSSGLDWRPGDNVVAARYEFPTNVFPWRALEELGVEVRTARLVDGRPDLLPVVDGRTRVVAVSFVQFWNGLRVDLAALGEELRRRGVLLAVDGIQGAGAVRVDLAAAPVDLFSAGGYKWLLGPMGLGFCYVHPELAPRLRPPLVGSGTPDDPGTALEPRWGLAQRAKRFEESAVSWLDVAGLLASVELLEEVGLDQVEARVLQLVDRAGELLLEAGCELAPPWPRNAAESSGIISFRHPAIDSTDLHGRLAEAGVQARNVSGEWVRFSIHFHNTEAELERAVAAVKQAV